MNLAAQRSAWVTLSADFPRKGETETKRRDGVSVVSLTFATTRGSPTARTSKGLYELGFRHARPSSNAATLRFVVQLPVCAPTGPAVRSQPSPTSRRDVIHRRGAGLTRLSQSGAFLVDGSGRDLLGQILGASLLYEALLDVLVLTLSLRTPRSPRHGKPPVVSCSCHIRAVERDRGAHHEPHDRIPIATC
jgi:hypothetical protein